MKKFFIYLIVFIFICFILPAFFTKGAIQLAFMGDEKDKTSETQEDNANQQEQENADTQNVEYDYKNYGTIKLLHHETGEVEEVNIDEYLYHVVSAEMPVDYEMEALKAQAVVARTYTIYKINNKKHDNADICDDSNCCQAWVSKDVRFSRWEESKREENWKKIQDCVNSTKGLIITYNNEPINAFFHANSGGKTEIPVNVWGGTGLPYLQVVETAGEEGYQQYNSEVELSNDDIINKLKAKYEDIQIDFNNDEDIKILEYTDSGRVKTVKFGNHEIAGTEARTIFGLRSTNFEIQKSDGKIKFVVKGYGHGVGMSQTGADSMAKQGSTYDEIIKHFYVGVEIKDINSL